MNKFSEDVIQSITDIRSKSKLADFNNKSVVIHNLVFMYQVILASERLMEDAIIEAEGELKYYLINHLAEERGHAKWLADDLLSASVDVKLVPTITKAAEMAGSQYYLIKHVNPACLLGYMAVLEGFPFPLETVDYLESIHGKELLRTLRFHAEHDLAHRIELFKMVDKYPLPDVMQNAQRTAIYMNELSEAMGSY